MLWESKSGRKCAVVTGIRQREVERTRTLNHVDMQVRIQRVQELRLAIAKGTYAVPVEQVADSLLRFANAHSRLQGAMYP